MALLHCFIGTVEAFCSQMYFTTLYFRSSTASKLNWWLYKTKLYSPNCFIMFRYHKCFYWQNTWGDKATWRFSKIISDGAQQAGWHLCRVLWGICEVLRQSLEHSWIVFFVCSLTGQIYQDNCLIAISHKVGRGRCFFFLNICDDFKWLEIIIIVICTWQSSEKWCSFTASLQVNAATSHSD